jgi:hypothetical protein
MFFKTNFNKSKSSPAAGRPCRGRQNYVAGRGQNNENKKNGEKNGGKIRQDALN